MLKHAAALCALVALTACSTTQIPQDGPLKSLPPEFVNEMNAVAYAETIASRCPSLAFNSVLEDRVLIGFAMELQMRGYTERDFNHAMANMDEDQMLRDVYRYIEKRNIQLERPGSWCRAGRTEMTEGSRIGDYLIRL